MKNILPFLLILVSAFTNAQDLNITIQLTNECVVSSLQAQVQTERALTMARRYDYVNAWNLVDEGFLDTLYALSVCTNEEDVAQLEELLERNQTLRKDINCNFHIMMSRLSAGHAVELYDSDKEGALVGAQWTLYYIEQIYEWCSLSEEEAEQVKTARNATNDLIIELLLSGE